MLWKCCLLIFSYSALFGAISVDNRVVAQVNGKSITVVELLKKMNWALKQHNQRLPTDENALVQFYSAQWRHFLDKVVEEELMVADATRLGVEIPDADVRQHLYERFAPHVSETLETMGLSFDEAHRMLKNELLLQRLLWGKVQIKALQRVHPKDVRARYARYLEENPPQEELRYQMVTFRGGAFEAREQTASQFCQILARSTAGLAQALTSLSEQVGNDVTASQSEILTVRASDLAPAYRQALVSLKPGEHSAPIVQENRGGERVCKVLVLHDRILHAPKAFREISEQLKEQMCDEAALVITKEYVAKLKKRFGYEPMPIPESFRPFSRR